MIIWEQGLIIIFSILLFVYCLIYGGESLYPFKNKKKMVAIVGTYIVIKGIHLAVFGIDFRCGIYIIDQIWSIPSKMIFSCLSFMGEEFAWRGYLQKKITGMYGKAYGSDYIGDYMGIMAYTTLGYDFSVESARGWIRIMIAARFLM